MERDMDIEEDLIAEEEYFWKENVGKGAEEDILRAAVCNDCSAACAHCLHDLRIGFLHTWNVRWTLRRT